MGARSVSSDQLDTVAKIPRHLAAGFAGFVEGRLQVPAPDAWRRNLFGVRLLQSGFYRFPILLNSPFEKDLRSLEERVESPHRSLPHVRCELKGSPAKLFVTGDSKFSGDTKSVSLPESLREKIDFLDKKKELCLAGIVIEDKAIIAVQNGVHAGGQLFCIPIVQTATNNDTILWQAKLDTSWNDELISEGGVYLELRHQNHDVFVFHSDSNCLGIEQFAIDSGKRVFTFSTTIEVKF